ncbi:hypothetical protein FACS1894130_11210 [Spirochaetia bacterium]|nr:hypothetical protein FACS1894130_11210 [Spirochaetia bacterium]
MTEPDRRLLIENTAALRGLNAKLKEFEKHVIGRIEKLEEKEGERGKDFKATLSLIISFCVLAVSIIVNFFRPGGK